MYVDSQFVWLFDHHKKRNLYVDKHEGINAQDFALWCCPTSTLIPIPRGKQWATHSIKATGERALLARCDEVDYNQGTHELVHGFLYICACVYSAPIWHEEIAHSVRRISWLIQGFGLNSTCSHNGRQWTSRAWASVWRTLYSAFIACARTCKILLLL